MTETIHPVHQLPREVALLGDTAVAYRLDDGPQAGMVVVEVLDAHQRVIARSIADAPGSREDVADLALGRSPLERCSDWAVHPIGRGKRVTAMLVARASAATRSLDALHHEQRLGA